MSAVKVNGLLITFEGIDGAGKSSHMQSTAQALQQAGLEVVVTREPGGTALAETLRELILNDKMDGLTESLLVFAARRDHLVDVIMPALARGAVVLSDRFTDSTFAYQGYGRGFNLQVLMQLEAWVQQGIQPDLTLWFDVPPELAAQRMSGARVPDRFEQESCIFFERVQQGYQARLEQNPQRIARIDAAQSIEDVASQVRHILKARGIV